MAHKVISWITRFLSHLSSKIAPIRNGNPSAALESLERWSAIATLVIFAGIALEFWATIHFQRPDETNWEVAAKLFADFCIGSGLIVEVVCILRAIVEGRREKSESDKKVAEANERAAVALREAEKIKAYASWRTLSNEERGALKLSLEKSGPPASVWLTVLANDPESLYFAQQFSIPFRAAQWQVGFRFASYATGIMTGILVPEVQESWLEEMKVVRGRVRDALIAAEMRFVNGWPPAPYMESASVGGLPTPIAWLYLGPKPPPE